MCVLTTFILSIGLFCRSEFDRAADKIRKWRRDRYRCEKAIEILLDSSVESKNMTNFKLGTIIRIIDDILTFIYL